MGIGMGEGSGARWRQLRRRKETVVVVVAGLLLVWMRHWAWVGGWPQGRGSRGGMCGGRLRRAVAPSAGEGPDAADARPQLWRLRVREQCSAL